MSRSAELLKDAVAVLALAAVALAMTAYALWSVPLAEAAAATAMLTALLRGRPCGHRAFWRSGSYGRPRCSIRRRNSTDCANADGMAPASPEEANR